MDHGSLCEIGSVSQVLRSPAHDYTRRLLDAAPTLLDAAEVAT